MKKEKRVYEPLSDAEMAKIKGGGRWVYEDGKWIWREGAR